MDDNQEQTGLTTSARCPNSLPRKPCRSRCGVKTKCGHPALEVHFLRPSDQSCKWTTGLELPCNLLVTGTKVDLQPSVRRRVSSATERAPSACACTSCAVKHKPRDSKVCTKRSPVGLHWSSSRLCDTERKDKLFKLLNEFGEIRERSRQAKEMLRESFAARRKSLKTQWCNEQDIDNLGDDLNLDEGGKQRSSICDTTHPKPDDECSNCGYSH